MQKHPKVLLVFPYGKYDIYAIFCFKTIYKTISISFVLKMSSKKKSPGDTGGKSSLNLVFMK